MLSPTWYLGKSVYIVTVWISFGEGRVIRSAYLGNLSASKTTQLTPSLASAEAVYDPPGPPPTTNTVVSVGIDIVSVRRSVTLRDMERLEKQSMGSKILYKSGLQQRTVVAFSTQYFFGRLGLHALYMQSRSCTVLLGPSYPPLAKGRPHPMTKMALHDRRVYPLRPVEPRLLNWTWR